MDAEEISRWALFVTRLVRAAERLAAESKPASPVSPSFMRRWETLWSAKHLGENVAENNKHEQARTTHNRKDVLRVHLSLALL